MHLSIGVFIDKNLQRPENSRAKQVLEWAASPNLPIHKPCQSGDITPLGWTSQIWGILFAMMFAPVWMAGYSYYRVMSLWQAISIKGVFDKFNSYVTTITGNGRSLFEGSSFHTFCPAAATVTFWDFIHDRNVPKVEYLVRRLYLITSVHSYFWRIIKPAVLLSLISIDEDRSLSETCSVLRAP